MAGVDDGWPYFDPDPVKMESLDLLQTWQLKDMAIDARLPHGGNRHYLIRMLSSSRPVCLICGAEDTWQWCRDHCHEHNRFRGWLCHACNVAVGRYESGRKFVGDLSPVLEHQLRCPECALRTTGQ